jgi:hypothetical protein
MINWGIIIGIALLVIAVVWAVWWFKRMMPDLRHLIKGIVKHLKK